MTGINNLAVIPMRAEPSDKAEMINQVLFGETFDILEENAKWSKIKLKHDDYIGWIDKKQWKEIQQQPTIATIVKQAFLPLQANGKTILVPMGSLLPEVPQETNISPTILETASLLLEAPYLWGGRTFMGIDCSGFTQVVFRANNIYLLRDAYQQATQGEIINIENIENNDLVFFQNDDSRITHVGIAFKQGNQLNVIHASGKVRIDLLDEKGIFNKETQSYSHKFHSARRVTQ